MEYTYRCTELLQAVSDEKSAGRTLTTQEIKHLHIKNVQKSSGNIDTLEYQVAIWQTSGSMKYFKYTWQINLKF